MVIRGLSFIVCALALAAVAHPAAAAAQPNPYTPEQVCGAGFYVIDKHKLFSGSRYTTHLATTFLLYNGATGQNCAATIKYHFVGRPTTTGVSLKVKGKRRPWVVDQDAFEYYAGPVYRTAPGRCIRFSGTVTTPYGTDTYISPFGHCR